MLFSSWIFVAAFLPLTWAVYRYLQNRAQKEASLLWLSAASLFFYGWFKPSYLLIILLSIGFNFHIGKHLSHKDMPKTRRKWLLALGIAANLCALFYYKYTGLFFQTLNMAGGHYDIPAIVLPLGISFFTFQEIAWLVDAYRRETKEFSFNHYLLFITFFPQLIAGPIVHHKEMLPQFTAKNKSAATDDGNNLLAAGLALFVIGLFKKVAIADHLGEIADPVFDAAALGNNLTLFEAWTGALAYSLQIYFDFSGYSDMAIGLGAMFGVRLPLNFFSPYKSADIIEFWRRWHITLSRFLRDYLYIPLGGNRHGILRRHANLMLTMLLGGLWHGSNWTFMFWGGLHGLYLVVNHVWRKTSPFRLPRPIGLCLTFLAVLVAWVFFRAPTLETALHVLACMTGENGLALRHPDGMLGGMLHAVGVDVAQTGSRLLRLNEKWHVLWAALGIALFAPSAHELMKRSLALDTTGIAVEKNGAGNAKGRWQRFTQALAWNPSLGWAVCLALMASLSLLLLTRVNAFIYFQF